MQVSIRAEQPNTPTVVELIAELEAVLNPHYPPESRHGYSVEKLIREGVAFFVIEVEGKPAGCGGIQFFGKEFGELKRMYVRPEFRGQGLGMKMVNHLAQYARDHQIDRLRLETGIHQKEAIKLYEGMGFQRIDAFPPYQYDPLSRYYEKRI